MYEVIEISMGNLSRLYQYKMDGIYGTNFNIKGFDYPWLLASHEWKRGEYVLDVGAAYSLLPLHIQETYGCEVWVADDFGLKSDDPFWQRGKSPHEHINNHPNVKFVLERLGDPQSSSLPKGCFDIVYSLSVLEHIPNNMVKQVWEHMDALLKPGGEMIHAIDFSFPSNQGWQKVVKGILFDLFYGFMPMGQRVLHYRSTPKAYVRLFLQTLGTRHALGKELSVLDMVLNPDILAEAYENGWNRIIKDKMTNYRYQRSGTLLIHVKKQSE
jgi:hypothetical protein